jgi:ABC-type polysaccharide/polyol phosphate export permease
MLEKNAPSSFRNFMLPVKESTFVLSIFATCLGVLVLQALIVIGIAAIFFGSVVFSALPVTLLTMLVLTALFTCLGMVVGYLFSSEATATLGAVFSGAALLFLSDVIIPIESMPPFLLAVARYNPFVLGGSILRKTILLAVPLSDIWLDMVILAVEAAVLGIAVYFTALRSRRTALRRYFRAQAVPLPEAKAAARMSPAPPKKPRDRIELRDS